MLPNNSMAILLSFSPLLNLFIIFLLILTITLLLSFPHKQKCPSSSPSYGPPSYPFIGCLLSFYQNRGRLLHWYTHLLAESPTQTIVVSRLGARRTIVTANPANVEYMLKTNFFNFPKGKPFTDILGDFLGRGIFNSDGERWRVQRKLASHEFSAGSLRAFVVRTLQEEVSGRLLPLLEAAADGGGVLDFQDILRKFAFDAICRVSLGVDPHCLGPTPDRDSWRLVEAFDGASGRSAARASDPVQAVWKIKRALNVGSERRLRRCARLVRDSVSEIIKSKKKILEASESDGGRRGGGGGAEPADLLSRLLAAGHDEEAVRDMVISFLLAGRDTTSAAMTWLFWLLSGHRSLESRAAAEAAPFTDKLLTFEDLKGMKFTTACLQEAMRLYPPVAWDSKHAAAADVLPDGTVVRAGDRVTYFPYGMGRMAALWGEDRLEFRPDRWLEGGLSDPELRFVSPFQYPVFQAGPRVCLGKEMAMVQMKYVVASVLGRFEVRSVRADPPVFVPLLTAHMAGGLKVVVRKRAGN